MSRWLSIAVLLLSVAIATACRSGTPASDASADSENIDIDSHEVELPDLPDLSAMAVSVQTQIRAQRDDLDRLSKASATAVVSASARSMHELTPRVRSRMHSAARTCPS